MSPKTDKKWEVAPPSAPVYTVAFYPPIKVEVGGTVPGTVVNTTVVPVTQQNNNSVAAKQKGLLFFVPDAEDKQLYVVPRIVKSAKPLLAKAVAAPTPWAEIAFASGFAAGTEVTFTHVSSGGSWSSGHQVKIEANAPVETETGYMQYLRDYRAYVELVTGEVTLRNTAAHGLRYGLGVARDQKKIAKKASRKEKLKKSPAPKKADPASARSLAKKEKKEKRAAEKLAAETTKAAAKVAADKARLLKATEEAKHSQKIAELQAVKKLQEVETSVAKVVARRGAAIRKADPSVQTTLDIENGWKLVTSTKKVRVKSEQTYGDRLAKDAAGKFSRTKVTQVTFK